MQKILVVYASMAGSTVEVAQVVAEEIAKGGYEVDLLPLTQVQDVATYDGVGVGAPMIMGWHRAALRFLRQHRKAWMRIPLAVFVTAMSLTASHETGVDSVPITVDEKLSKPPQQEGRLTFRERYATLANYLHPILRAPHPAKPVSIGVFGGRLEYGRLPWWAILFVMLIIQAPAGDRRNWPAIRAWAATIPTAFHLEATREDGVTRSLPPTVPTL
jgi:menaquinone-dependent protoporphyrinogen IX oxidase